MKNKKRLDKLWQRAITARDRYCQICGKTEGLNAHHIYSRSRLNTRYDCENGILLCPGCHCFSSLLSAHKAPRAFLRWLENRKGKKWLDMLEIRSQIIAKGLDYAALEIYLQKEIDKYK